MAPNPRQMLGLGNTRPSMQYQQLNQAFQSDPRRILGQALMQQGASTAPVRTPLQGLGRLSSALVGAYLQRKAGDTIVEREGEMTNQIMGMLPENATAGQRAFAAANPVAFSQMAGQAQFMPTTTSELANMGEFTGVRTTVTNPFTGATSSSIGNLTQPRPTVDRRTSAQKNAEALGLVAGTPEYNEFIRKSAAPDRTTNINMTNSPGSTATVEKIVQLSNNATTAQNTLNRVEQMLNLVDEGIRNRIW